MAKPTTYATPICIVLSILVIIGLIWGFLAHNALIVVLFLLPAVGYEAYRTEGDSTRWASWMLAILIIAEIICIIFKLNFDLASYFSVNDTYAMGYSIPLSDIKVIFPLVMLILSITLFLRTIGKYTKWLAVLIFISSLATVYILDPTFLKQFVGLLLGRGLYYF